MLPQGRRRNNRDQQVYGRRSGKQPGVEFTEDPRVAAGEKQCEHCRSDEQAENVERCEYTPGDIRLLDGFLQERLAAGAYCPFAGWC